MNIEGASSRLFKRLSSKGGLATPVSTLMIFFSLTMVTTITFYYAIDRIDSQKDYLKLIAVEEKMLELEASISSTAWSPGSSRVSAFSNYGGSLDIDPTGNLLMLNLTLGASNEILFNDSIGIAVYQLPYNRLGHLGDWLRGDRRAIVNKSSAYQAQVHIEQGTERQELIVCYRPLVSSSVGGLVDGRRVNNIRIHIINLNGSQAFSSEGEFQLKATCDRVSSNVRNYNLSSSVTSVSVIATLDGYEGTVEIPITSGPSGSTVIVEVLVSHIELNRVSV